MVDKKYDIIIQAGQSNAEGSGRGPVSAEKEYIPQSNIVYLTSQKTVECKHGIVEVNFTDNHFSVEIAEERKDENGQMVGDFSLSFAKDYLASDFAKNGRDLLIVRCGIGGTSFAQNHWGLHDECYLKMIKMVDYALQLNGDNRVVAFLWHQGESDVINNSSADEYYDNLNNLLNAVRIQYGDIPFIAGDFVYDWKNKNLNICNPIIQEICRVINNNKLSAFVETNGLLSNDQQIGNGDDIHFCRAALYELGHRYFKAFFEINKGNLLNGY